MRAVNNLNNKNSFNTCSKFQKNLLIYAYKLSVWSVIVVKTHRHTFEFCFKRPCKRPAKNAYIKARSVSLIVDRLWKSGLI